MSYMNNKQRILAFLLVLIIIFVARNVIYPYTENNKSREKEYERSSYVSDSDWVQHNIKDTDYRIDYPSTFTISTDEPKKAILISKDGSIQLEVSDIEESFEKWKECSADGYVRVLDSPRTIKYLCNGTQFKFFSDMRGGLFISANVSETDFYDTDVRTLFRMLLQTFTVQ